jgi:hypothetical protein
VIKIGWIYNNRLGFLAFPASKSRLFGAFLGQLETEGGLYLLVGEANPNAKVTRLKLSFRTIEWYNQFFNPIYISFKKLKSTKFRGKLNFCSHF